MICLVPNYPSSLLRVSGYIPNALPAGVDCDKRVLAIGYPLIERFLTVVDHLRKHRVFAPAWVQLSESIETPVNEIRTIIDRFFRSSDSFFRAREEE